MPTVKKVTGQIYKFPYTPAGRKLAKKVKNSPGDSGTFGDQKTMDRIAAANSARKTAADLAAIEKTRLRGDPNPQEKAYGGGGTTGLQAQTRNTIRTLQPTRKPPGTGSDIINENVNQGFGKGQKLTVKPANKTQSKLTVKKYIPSDGGKIMVKR